MKFEKSRPRAAVCENSAVVVRAKNAQTMNVLLVPQATDSIF
jgi:hypothetical protein